MSIIIRVWGILYGKQIKNGSVLYRIRIILTDVKIILE